MSCRRDRTYLPYFPFLMLIDILCHAMYRYPKLNSIYFRRAWLVKIRVIVRNEGLSVEESGFIENFGVIFSYESLSFFCFSDILDRISSPYLSRFDVPSWWDYTVWCDDCSIFDDCSLKNYGIVTNESSSIYFARIKSAARLNYDIISENEFCLEACRCGSCCVQHTIISNVNICVYSLLLMMYSTALISPRITVPCPT